MILVWDVFIHLRLFKEYVYPGAAGRLQIIDVHEKISFF